MMNKDAQIALLEERERGYLAELKDYARENERLTQEATRLHKMLGNADHAARIARRQGMERAAEIAETGEWNRGFEPEEIAQAISAEIKGTEK